jgi:hypothetical protein
MERPLFLRLPRLAVVTRRKQLFGVRRVLVLSQPRQRAAGAGIQGHCTPVRFESMKTFHIVSGMSRVHGVRSMTRVVEFKQACQIRRYIECCMEVEKQGL